MEMFKCFSLALFGGLAVVIQLQVLQVHGQDQSGFISLDCGLPRDSNYTETTTGLNYSSDASFIDTGLSRSILPEFRTNVQQQMWYVRSFPGGPRNCYNFRLQTGNKYLIRASFMYGNYDSQDKALAFDLHLGPNLWFSVRLENASTFINTEIIHVLSSNNLYVCLVNTGNGTPFISALELRHLMNSIYKTQTGSLDLFARLDIGSKDNETIRSLRGNMLNGSVPVELVERSKNGSLLLSVEENRNPCSSASCKIKKFIAPVVASAAAFFVLVIALAALRSIKRRKTQGFATVYHGYLDGSQVAVKMLSSISVQSYKKFQAKVEPLLGIHHRNLTSLVGYCDEDTNKGLIYEYMSNGNFEHHLSESNTNILSWEQRLKIAMGAAQGLEPLHNGSKPPIIHRDVNPTNILLNEDLQAKLADFGLSRTFPVDDDTPVSTLIAGTPGYQDPEYIISNNLTEKSDVYSFGVVLLETITSRLFVMKSHETVHISDWVNSMLSNGDAKNIVDTRLQGDFDMNSLSKAIELA
ncbi:Serine-threonine/tyrosine-protein kinase [Theobroma cacao]|nr:Serine-threonine/tyrosine-protein kinase [Theobroma cacao]